MNTANRNDLITKVEMIDLTGTSQKEKQCASLRLSGIRFSKTHDGWPRLTWEAYNRQLAAGGDNRVEHSSGTPGFNLKAL